MQILTIQNSSQLYLPNLGLSFLCSFSFASVNEYKALQTDSIVFYPIDLTLIIYV